MAHNMDKPTDPADLYRAFGDDVNPARPVLTGDVFEAVEVTNLDGTSTPRTVMLLDHPCSLRGEDGLNLAPRLVTAEVRPTTQGSWRQGNYNRMFLPPPFPLADGKANPCAAFFDSSYHVTPEQLAAGRRIACLSTVGINIMLQRRVKHFSRVTVPTMDFLDANLGVFEEADLIEDWCLLREDDDVKTDEAVAECVAWLREDIGGRRRQDLLKDPQQRSTVRQQLRERRRELRAARRP
ncbi:hypothetical protein [Streptomyces sp. NPDC001758]